VFALLFSMVALGLLTATEIEAAVCLRDVALEALFIFIRLADGS
jgi:hypothetical protein